MSEYTVRDYAGRSLGLHLTQRREAERAALKFTRRPDGRDVAVLRDDEIVTLVDRDGITRVRP